MNNNLVIVRGGGDIASGIIHKLYRCGFDVLVLETDKPTSIRREVCFSEAIYEKIKIVENVRCIRIDNTLIKENDLLREEDILIKEGISTKVDVLEQIKECFNKKIIPIMIDKSGEIIEKLKPLVVVDSILAKKNIGTNKSMAPITIGVGPGFNAPNDVSCVVETMRGHDLGKIIFDGCALKNTGIPGSINGVSKDRVIYSKKAGTIRHVKNIGDIVKKNEIIAYIDESEVLASIDGVLRGMIRDFLVVKDNFKIADIDPRLDEVKNCYTISDKARCIAGSVLEAILYLKNNL